MSDAKKDGGDAKKETLPAKAGRFFLWFIILATLLFLVGEIGKAIFPKILSSLVGLVDMLVKGLKDLFRIIIGPVIVIGILYLIIGSFKKKVG